MVIGGCHPTRDARSTPGRLVGPPTKIVAIMPPQGGRAKCKLTSASGSHRHSSLASWLARHIQTQATDWEPRERRHSPAGQAGGAPLPASPRGDGQAPRRAADRIWAPLTPLNGPDRANNENATMSFPRINATGDGRARKSSRPISFVRPSSRERGVRERGRERQIRLGF